MQQLYLVLGTFFACYVGYLSVRRRLQARHLPPKYASWDIFMNLDYIFSTAMTAELQLQNFKKLGSTFRLRTWKDPLALIVTCDAENVHEILAGKSWGVGFREAGMKQFLGAGFICADGADWMRSRKMIRPAFSRPNIDNFDTLEGVADNLIKKIKDADGKVEMGSLLYDALMHSSMSFILGIDSTANEDGRPISTQTFNDLWKQGILGMGLRLLLGETGSMILPKASYRNVCSKVHKFVEFAIDKRQTQSQDTTRKTKCMSEIVTPQARDTADARSQLMQTMLASQDTTGILTCNALQLLSQHPQIWSQLQEEIKSGGDDLMTWEGLRSNTFIQNILSETLRVRPIFPQTGRATTAALVLPRGGGRDGRDPLPIPAGTFAIANVWGLHMSKEVYGLDAEEFRPDRWNTVKPSNKEFAPFGSGSRACLGKDKALAEAAYLIARLAQHFESVEDRTGLWKPEASFSMKNKKGYEVTFR